MSRHLLLFTVPHKELSKGCSKVVVLLGVDAVAHEDDKIQQHVARCLKSYTTWMFSLKQGAISQRIPTQPWGSLQTSAVAIEGYKPQHLEFELLVRIR